MISSLNSSVSKRISRLGKADEMVSRRSIAVSILGHEYRIRSDADEQFVRRVAALVDDTMARIRERTQTVDSLDLAVLAAVNLANDLLIERDRLPAALTNRNGSFLVDSGRVAALRELVESVDPEAAARS
jgi:cell division protein ZapA